MLFEFENVVSFCKLGFKDALATYIPSPVMLPDIAVHVYRANPKRKTKSSTSSASSHDLWLWTFTMYFSCDWILTQHAKCILFDVGDGLGVRLFYRAMWCQEQQLMTTLKKEWWPWSRCFAMFHDIGLNDGWKLHLEHWHFCENLDTFMRDVHFL